MTFKNAYGIMDKLKAENFEGVPRSYYFTPQQWYYSRNLQKWVLIKPYLDENRSMAMTKVMLNPL